MRATGILTSRWLVSFAGAALIAGPIWFFGPLLAPLEPPVVRLVLVLMVFLTWSSINYAISQQRRQHDSALINGVVADDNLAAEPDEAAALRERLAAALRLMKKTRGRRGHLYERPWYAIVGPPGAGKTTALLNAGLRFPLTHHFGRDAVQGVGGTRYCDWWFTEEAVLIDTAGRYTSMDSDAGVDRAGWDAFLDLLKRTRPRQPLNGVIVAVALGDIVRAPAEERMAHARAIRRRVRELQTRLGLRLPIYMLFTKTDLITGFSEFFDDLNSGERAQVWGTTFDPTADESKCVDTFVQDFRIMVERLQARLPRRLQAEGHAARRALIAMFPSQVASLEPLLVEFLKAAFSGYPLHLVPMLRGIFLSSATQEGRPFDRLAGVLSRVFGLEQRQAAKASPEHGRSYFLESLLRDVIFGEAMLLADPTAIRRRRKLTHSAGQAVAALIVVASCAWLWNRRDVGLRQVSAGETAVTVYDQIARTLPLDPVGNAAMPRLLPILDHARTFSLGLEDGDKPISSWLRLGLSQEPKMAAGARVMYRHALERVLLPRLVWQLETQMRDNLDSPDFLYEATRIYLMLGSAGPLDRPSVHDWMRLAWQNMYPGSSFAATREHLLLHLDALLGEPLPAVELDGSLVQQARSRFGRVSMSQRAYARIRLSAVAQRVAPWRPSDALNAVGMALFRRDSGKPLSEAIPGLFTIDGFHRVVLAAVASAVRNALAESWVVGQRTDIDPDDLQMDALEREVIGLYEADFAQAWDQMLADLNMRPLTSISQAAQDLYILESLQSPMRALLTSIARQLTLSVSPGQSPGDREGGQTASGPDPDSAAGRLQAVLGHASSGVPGNMPPGREIDLRYAGLRALVGSGAASPLDQVLRSLNDMQQQFAKAAAAGTSPLLVGPDPAVALKVEALRQPQPVARWLTTLATSGGALRGGELRR